VFFNRHICREENATLCAKRQLKRDNAALQGNDPQWGVNTHNYVERVAAGISTAGVVTHPVEAEPVTSQVTPV